jgi:uncharacterized membrane protein
MTLYVFLKFLHVLLAIVAVGFNASYGIWLARAARDRDQAMHILRGIKVLDDRFANPAYGLLLATGIAMLFAGPYSLSTPWIATALAIYVLVVILGIALYSPILQRQTVMAEAGEVDTAEYARLARRGAAVGGVLAVLVVVIVFLMVTKPALWD